MQTRLPCRFWARAILPLTLLLAACSSSTSESFDPASVDLAVAPWNAQLPFTRFDAQSGMFLSCTANWTETFDSTVFAAPESLFTVIPSATSVQCPGLPDSLWSYRGISLVVTRSADSVHIVPNANPTVPFAELQITSSTRIAGSMADGFTVSGSYEISGPLVLTR